VGAVEVEDFYSSLTAYAELDRILLLLGVKYHSHTYPLHSWIHNYYSIYLTIFIFFLLLLEVQLNL